MRKHARGSRGQCSCQKIVDKQNDGEPQPKSTVVGAAVIEHCSAKVEHLGDLGETAKIDEGVSTVGDSPGDP